MFKNKKSSAGIESLIMFMIAIIIAGVFSQISLRTANNLQAEAKNVGLSARERTSNIILIERAQGLTTNNQLEELALTINIGPGGDYINLNKLGITLMPDQITYLLNKNTNNTFYNQEKIYENLCLGDEYYISLDMNSDKYEDKIVFSNFNEIDFKLGTYNSSIEIPDITSSSSLSVLLDEEFIISKNNQHYALVQISGTSSVDNCLNNANITITPYKSTGLYHNKYLIKAKGHEHQDGFLMYNEISKVSLDIPEKKENQEFSLQFSESHSHSTTYDFLIPNILINRIVNLR
jgi:archaellin